MTILSRKDLLGHTTLQQRHLQARVGWTDAADSGDDDILSGTPEWGTSGTPGEESERVPRIPSRATFLSKYALSRPKCFFSLKMT